MVPSDLSSASFFLVAALLVPGSQLDDSRRGAESDALGAARFPGGHGREDPRPEAGEPQRRTGGRHRGGALRAARRRRSGATDGGVDRRDPGAGGAGRGDRRRPDGARCVASCASRRRTASGPWWTTCGAWAWSAEELPDGLVVPGRQKFRAARFDSFGDHRIAMAFAVAALAGDGESVIEGAEAASVSFPEFWDTLGLHQ